MIHTKTFPDYFYGLILFDHKLYCFGTVHRTNYFSTHLKKVRKSVLAVSAGKSARGFDGAKQNLEKTSARWMREILVEAENRQKNERQSFNALQHLASYEFVKATAFVLQAMSHFGVIADSDLNARFQSLFPEIVQQAQQDFAQFLANKPNEPQMAPPLNRRPTVKPA